MLKVANGSMLALTTLVCLGQFVFWYDKLPAVVPSHFDGTGQANGWMSKFGFYLLMGSLQALLLVGTPMLGRLIKNLPDSMLNIPNKDYWLAPERREGTLDLNSCFLGTVGWLTSWLFIAIFHISALVATEQQASVNPQLYWAIGIYVVTLFLATTRLLWRFRFPAGERGDRITNLADTDNFANR